MFSGDFLETSWISEGQRKQITKKKSTIEISDWLSCVIFWHCCSCVWIKLKTFVPLWCTTLDQTSITNCIFNYRLLIIINLYNDNINHHIITIQWILNIRSNGTSWKTQELSALLIFFAINICEYKNCKRCQTCPQARRRKTILKRTFDSWQIFAFVFSQWCPLNSFPVPSWVLKLIGHAEENSSRLKT